MKVKLIGKTQLVNVTLPQRIYGNYWITNENDENLINIEAINNRWFIKSNDDVKIVDTNGIVSSTELVQNHFYYFQDEQNGEKYRVFVGETFDSKMLLLDFTETGDLSFFIGNSLASNPGKPNYISYENSGIAYNQIQILRTNGLCQLVNLNLSVNVYVNNYVVTKCYLHNGDVVFCEGLTFSIVGNTLMLGTVDNKVKYASNKFTNHKIAKLDYEMINNLNDANIDLFNKDDYFIRPPRFNIDIKTKEINIDNPPQKQESENVPIILTLGPMVIMGMSSSITGVMALAKVVSGEVSLKQGFPSILTALCMLAAMLVFPFANKAYQKKREKKKEQIRQNKYREYLQTIDKQIKDECTYQKRILIENNVDLNNVGDVILYKKRNLWERRPIHDDFLTLRLGIGNVLPKIDVKYSAEHFTLEEDELEKELKKVINQNNVLADVPVTMNFREKYVSALIGKYSLLRRFMDGLILQMIAYHSYDELKIIIFTNKSNKLYWEKMKDSPYCWNNEKSMRYFASDADEALRISSELESIYQERINQDPEKKQSIFTPHYLIITDDVFATNKLGIFNSILKSKRFCGFTIMYLTDKLNSLPSECSSFISIDTNVGGIFEQELVNKKQEFVPDFINKTIDSYIFATSNIPIETRERAFELPTVYSFMEMYNAGNVEQLNAYNRWQKNDPTTSLSCPVGIDENGELFKIDLHEKVHGPHGLIAGMTGSGKSEFIITYILSMAVNYNPNEVQFVLIDYKGGGLAGAFENKETGVKLPHLAGTITNLDVNEINRSLSSLQSELKRRQRIFNEARDNCGESTIDIYKYQKLFREGKVTEPIAHLFIICDEFAELKTQQPDFMDELISTARIGRSLGVHLILATQKPSGVVDDQIWSNSKFRVCLKVQDKSDSNDMIKSPDAAYIKETGRFYLQVGFNEFFAKGQSAWCGAPYYESEKRKKVVDNSINFVDNIGDTIKSIANDKQNLRGVHKGEELSNVLSYLANLGNSENINVRQLWLDALPENILIDKLKEKYHFKKTPFVINPVVGEYDAPKEQRQNILTVPMSENGNLLIYGAIGSGKENLVSSLIYSLITTYSVDEVNLYVVDFGSEALRMYTKAPHIGGIVSAEDKDRLANLFRLLNQKIAERKKLFADYNGSYDYYCKHSGKTVPTIITIINGYESFNENYSDLAEDIMLLTREGVKYGILFVTTVSSTNNIRMKIAQNFSERLVLQLNDEYDYRQLLGRTEVVPGKVMGRGLAKREDIYEFQTAYPCKLENINEQVSTVIDKLNTMYPQKAERIPTLPEVVTTSFVSSEFKGLSQVPIGVAKDNLKILSVDMQNQTSLLVSGSRINDLRKFVNSFVYELSTVEKTAVYVIDAERIVDEEIKNIKHYTNSFDRIFAGFKKVVSDLSDIYVKNGYDNDALKNYGNMVFVIIGINKIKTILGADFDKLVGDTLMESKKLSKISYVFVDAFDNLKKLEYDLWYKDIVNSTRGIWIGNGLAEQSIFKLFSSTRSISNNIPSNFGYNIVSGMPTLFKYIESNDSEDTL